MSAGAQFSSGVIEGFFGKSWSWQARLDNVRFLGEWGYRFYIYAPKSDPFLRRRWRDPIPAETMERLGELHRCCRQWGLELGVGLSPFEIYLHHDADAREALRAKVRQINEIGAETLCILFDDMRGDIDGLAQIQADVAHNVCTWSGARNFILCPTYYSYDPRLSQVFGPVPKSYLHDLGRMVDPGVQFFWTGEKVISDAYPEQHLAVVANEIGRKPFIWDNHIANDSKMRTNFLYLDPSVSSWNLAADQAAGLAINPMNQPYLSRIALAGYRRLLSGVVKDELLAQVCRALLQPSLATRLLTDTHRLQDVGLSGLDTDARQELLNRYSGYVDDPYARELCAWLGDAYAFDPECLTE